MTRKPSLRVPAQRNFGPPAYVRKLAARGGSGGRCCPRLPVLARAEQRADACRRIAGYLRRADVLVLGIAS